MNRFESHWVAHLALCLCAFASALQVQGCHAKRGEHAIVLVPIFSTEMVALCAHAGMDAAVEGTPLHVRFNGPPDGDEQRQIDIVTDAIDRDVYGVAIMPPRLYSANGIVRQAMSRGIPVVVLLHPIPLAPQRHLSFVVENLRFGTRLAAMRVQETAPAGSHVLLASLDALSAGVQDRLTAMQEAVQQFDPQNPVTRRITHAAGSIAFTSAIRQALSDDPKLRTIIALDSQGAYWSAAILHEQKENRHVKLIAFDQSAEVLSALRHGDVDAVVAQDMRTMGRRAVENMVRDHRQQPVPPITEVRPLLVTRENIDSEPVQRVLLMNWVQR